MGLIGLGSAFGGGGGGFSASGSSSAGTGDVGFTTGGINFAPKSAASSFIDPTTLLIIGAIAVGIVAFARKGK